MKLINIENYEIKTARTDQKVPVVNGVHLHSVYSPNKEAEGLVEKHLESLEAKPEVLILGLGFAYHVNEIITALTKIHGDKFKIIVIEPNISIYNDCIELNLLNKKNVLVYAGFSAEELYADLDLVHFLLKKPTVIAHPPSFNLYSLYFKNFLTFEAPTELGASMKFVQNKAVYEYLSSFDQSSTLDTTFKNVINEKSSVHDLDFLTMALFEITNKTKQNQTQKDGDL